MFKFASNIAVLALGVAAASVAHGAPPRIAVTDLAYETRVSDYFRVSMGSSRQRLSQSASVREGLNTYSERERLSASSESRYYEAEGTHSYIEYGELRKYTADLKAAMLQGGGVRLVQARPYKGKPNATVYDIVARIRQGSFAGADYVLFGTVSDIQFNQSTMSFGGGASSAVLALDMSVDFSLINTRTLEVKAAFSALGSGQDVKLFSQNGHATFSRPKVVAEASRSLAEAAYSALAAQLALPERAPRQLAGEGLPPVPVSRNEPVVTY